MITKEKKFLKDTIAKKLLKEEACHEYVASIIASLLHLKKEYVVENLTLVDTEMNTNQNRKKQEADVVFLENEHIINIEINYNNSSQLQTKNNSYLAHLYLKQIKPGEPYPKIKPIIQINLNNFDLFKKKEFIYHSILMEDKYHLVRDKSIEKYDINIDFLSKVDYNEIEKLNEKDLRWLLYIFVCEDKELREEVYGGSEMMKKVSKEIDNYEAFLDQWLYYDKEEIDNAGFYQKGLEDKAIETAKKMLKDGLDNKMIAKYSGLSLEDVQKLKKEK